MHHQDGKAVGTRAEEADITERQIAGEAIDDVHALGENEKDHEVEQQEMILIDAWQQRKDGEQRRDDEQGMLEGGASADFPKFAIHFSNTFLRTSESHGR